MSLPHNTINAPHLLVVFKFTSSHTLFHLTFTITLCDAHGDDVLILTLKKLRFGESYRRLPAINKAMKARTQNSGSSTSCHRCRKGKPPPHFLKLIVDPATVPAKWQRTSGYFCNNKKWVRRMGRNES